MRTDLVAVHLLPQAQQRPETAIGHAFHGILTANMRKHAGDQAALIDWAIACHAIASSIAAVFLADGCLPDESVLAVWSGRTLP